MQDHTETTETTTKTGDNVTTTAMPPYQLACAWIGRILPIGLLLSVPSEFWIQVMAVLEVPDPIRQFVIVFSGAACSTIVEVIQKAAKVDALRRAGRLDPTWTDPTAKYWPGKLFVGTMFGMFCSSIIGPGVQAIIPGVTPTATGFLTAAVGYWFLSKKLPKMLRSKEDE